MSLNTTRWSLLSILFLLHVTSCQRYAERIPLQVDTRPLYELYDQMNDDDYGTEDYDFGEDPEVYRWNVEDYPHPINTPMFCHRMKASRVCDPDQVLTKEQADSLDTLIQQLFQETPCICDKCQTDNGGIRLGIALMKNVFQPYNEHPSKIIRSFAEHLRTKWALGECDNDILIVLATTDRLSYTDVGLKTSSYVSTEEAYRIFLENKALFSGQHFYEGLNAMLKDYLEKTRTMTRLQPTKKKIDVSMITGIIVGVVVVLAVVVLLVILYFKKCKSPKNMQKIDKFVDNEEGEKTSSWKRRDIKVMLGSLMSTNKTVATDQYSPQKTDEKKAEKVDLNPQFDDEIIDTTLQVCPIDVPDAKTQSSNAEDNLLAEVTSASDDNKQEVEEMEESAATESDAFIQSKNLSSFEYTRDYKGPVTDF